LNQNLNNIPFITSREHQVLNNHGGACIWFTGLSGSGKSTLAKGLEHELYKLKIHTFLLDGDIIRKGLNKDLGFSDDDRSENIRRVSEVSKLFVDAGIVVLVSFISPFKKDRRTARSLFEQGKFIEIYVECDLSECEKRDSKGLYKKARSGEVKDFTGISSTYESPENPEIIIQNGKDSNLQKNIELMINYLNKNKII
jgi:adenylylsulfate kinase